MTLPQGWVETKLGNVVTLNYGSSLPASSRAPGKVPVFGSNGVVGSHSVGLVPGPAIIVGRKGSAGRIHPSFGECYPIDTTYYIDDFDVVDFSFAQYLLDSLSLDKLDRATAIPGLNREDAYRISVAIPPLCEQRRIVAKLDALIAHLARARAELDRVPVLASKMRRGVLAETFALTDEQAERTTTAELCDSITDGDHQAPPRVAAGVPFITISAMNGGHIDLGRAMRFVPPDYFSRLKDTRRPRTGDVLYSVTGSFGIPALVRTDDPFVFQRHIAILRPAPHRCDPKWLAYALAAPQVRAQAEEIATGTAQMTVPLKGLRAFSLPRLDTAEQRKQVVYLDAVFARADRLEAEAARARALLDRLEATILAKAFRGELVPQDPNDEPASVLLDRIRAERAAAPKPKRGRARKAVG